MADLKITSIKCIRKQDFGPGDDEPTLYIGGLRVWEGKMSKGESINPKITRSFSDNVVVELKEQDNNKKEKSLGKWTLSDTPTPVGNAPLTATSSGFHYEVHFDVV